MRPPVNPMIVPAVDRIAAAFRTAHQAKAKSAGSLRIAKMLAGLKRDVVALQERIRMMEMAAGAELRTVPDFEKVTLELLFNLADLLDIVSTAQDNITQRHAMRNQAQHYASAAVLELCLRSGIPVSKGNEGVAAQILDYVFRSGGYFITEPRKWIASALQKLPWPVVDGAAIVISPNEPTSKGQLR